MALLILNLLLPLYIKLLFFLFEDSFLGVQVLQLANRVHVLKQCLLQFELVPDWHIVFFNSFLKYFFRLSFLLMCHHIRRILRIMYYILLNLRLVWCIKLLRCSHQSFVFVLLS